VQGVASFAEWLNELLSRRLAHKKMSRWIEARRGCIVQQHSAHVKEVNADYKGEQRAGSHIASFSSKTGKVLRRWRHSLVHLFAQVLHEANDFFASSGNPFSHVQHPMSG
jgi:hypothetical protein